MGLTVIAIAVPVLAAIASLTVILTLDRRHLARAGIGNKTPACARCLYPLGGWSSPTCPECGSDVRRGGVRFGPRARIGRTVVGIWIITFILLPVLMAISASFFATCTGACDWIVVPLGQQPLFGAQISTTYSWQRFPLQRASATILVVGEPSAFGWWSGRRVMTTSPRGGAGTPPITFTYVIAHPSQVPSVGILAANIEQAQGAAPGSGNADARELYELIMYHHVEVPADKRVPSSSLRIARNSGTSTSGSTWASRPAASLIATMLGLSATCIAWRRWRTGERSPMVNEWRDAGRATQPLVWSA